MPVFLMLKYCVLCVIHHFAPIDLCPHLLTLIMIYALGNRQKMKEDMSLSNLGTVALHAAKLPTNVFSSTLICILTLDYTDYL